jgi:hypothetical protein
MENATHAALAEQIEARIILVRGLRVMLAEEVAALRSQTVTLKMGRGEHRKYQPLVFTEQGVAMLSSVLRSKRAVHESPGDQSRVLPDLAPLKMGSVPFWVLMHPFNNYRT